MWRRPDGAWGSARRHPGGTPAASTPNDQTYWDGQTWTARRRWTAGKGWLVAGMRPTRRALDTSPPSAGAAICRAIPYVADPFVGMAPARSKATGFTFNLGVLLLLVCGIALMYGSVGEWIHVSGNVGIADFHVHPSTASIPGSRHLIRVNGYVTFIGGILLVIFACFEMTSRGDPAWRS